ncbi:gephyrin-like molybdotransferase Glp [Mycolicibacterium hippocampi]|uniref:Molybdopterin molybdenumtransferase n=1 Tax=Mycolicibacterium hippocampi TaxID=659824 RepID=A0A850PS08_9MYCO|nr:gephyrin-like molybdotransferase Glp [Mycolicibacterium hippocampi]NVN53099.1 Molybdopterin molybdenumtransferase [Mycolicibacterium hippocampi]
MRSVEEHRQVVADLITARPPVTLPVADTLGLVLADDVVAPLSLPGFDNSAMDGYAVLVDDIATATEQTPVRLPVTEDIPAGRTDMLTITAGTAQRIMTGAPLPSGATGVVPVEATDGGIDTVTIRASVRPGQHIRRAGEDVTAGSTVLRAGQVVTPAVLGLAAALGLPELTVIPRQRVLVLSTGTELVAPGTPLQPGQIYESNAVMLAAAVRDAGGEVVASPVTGDDVDAFRETLGMHSGPDGSVDLVVTTGGVSAGAYEVVKDALSGTVEFVKVAMQPGMPQGAGVLDDDANTAIITLPGNPVSALVSFEVFIRPALRAAMGLPNPDRPRRTAVLAEDLTSPRGKRQFRRGVLTEDTVTSYGPPASHHLRWLASANCLLELDEDTAEVAAGQRVQVWDLR